ncbi:MAG: hypothetical protein GY749_06120 [Desulfobacteraceae bacterium]|nr:hypothetical protein [Desulfobacteraceae bacterium]
MYKARSGNSPPDEFSLISPENGARISPTYYKDEDVYLMILKWDNTSDPDGDRFSYTITLSKDNNTIQKQGIYSNRCIVELPTDWVDNGGVDWKVEAVDEYGASRESVEKDWMFYAINDNESSIIMFHVRDACTSEAIEMALIDGELVENGKCPISKDVDATSYAYNIKAEAIGYKSQADSVEFIAGGTDEIYTFCLIPNKSCLGNSVTALQITAGIILESENIKMSDVSGDSKIGLEEAIYMMQCEAMLRCGSGLNN